MRWLVLISILILAFVVTSCGPVEVDCKKPFIKSDGKCCLDLDDNSICDEDQDEKEKENAIVEEETEEVKADENETSEEKKEVKVQEKQETEEPAEETEEKQETTEEAEEETTAEEEEDELTEYLKELQSKVPEEPETKMEELLTTFAQKVNGYKYVYQSNWYYVRGDNIKVRLHAAFPVTGVTIGNKYYTLFYYDNVYLNKREKTARGYCEGTDPRVGERQCMQLEIEDIPFELSYERYYEKLPEEWLFEYLDKTPTEVGEDKYYIRGRSTTKVEFEEGDKITRMFFDETTGLPIKVEIERGAMDEIYNYEELTAGTVREGDVVHRTKDEIPSTEAFYSTYS